jgi:dTDP-4-dehydrorhamnose reductase
VKHVVFGASGQLGRDLCPRLPGDVVPLTRSHADLTRPQELRQLLQHLRPDVVVNCAAYNFVDRAESETETAFAVNAWGVRALAEVCRDLDCVLAHFSSDYVFGLDGQRRIPYAAADAPGPLSAYGLSKLVGEYLIRSLVARHFIVRTCGLYGVWGAGGKGGNFVETMLRLAGQGKPLRVVNDQECTPSYTVDVAEATAALVQTQQYGVHHLTNGGSCTWHALAQTIFELTGVQADLTPIASTEWQAAARRPAYSVLACSRTLRPWREALAAYLRERTAGSRH